MHSQPKLSFRDIFVLAVLAAWFTGFGLVLPLATTNVVGNLFCVAKFAVVKAIMCLGITVHILAALATGAYWCLGRLFSVLASLVRFDHDESGFELVWNILWIPISHIGDLFFARDPFDDLVPGSGLILFLEEQWHVASWVYSLFAGFALKLVGISSMALLCGFCHCCRFAPESAYDKIIAFDARPALAPQPSPRSRVSLYGDRILLRWWDPAQTDEEREQILESLRSTPKFA